MKTKSFLVKFNSFGTSSLTYFVNNNINEHFSTIVLSSFILLFGGELTFVFNVGTSLKSFIVLMSQLLRSSMIVVECLLQCFVQFITSFQASQRNCNFDMATFNIVISYLMTKVSSCISTTRSSNMDVFFATAIYKAITTTLLMKSHN